MTGRPPARTATSRRQALPSDTGHTFGQLLRLLRKRAWLTQRELGSAVGYSEAQICRLEQDRRRPDPTTVAALFIPALRLSQEPELALDLVGRAHDARSAARAAGPANPGPGHGPPAAPRCAVPRPGALAVLLERLDTDRGVLLVGMAGVGKTTLAADAARALSARTCWVTVEPGLTSSAEALLRRLAAFLGVDEVAAPVHGREPPAVAMARRLEVLDAALARQPTLLCLDRGEGLEAPRAGAGPRSDSVPELLQHLVTATPTRIIVTSREQLALPGLAVLPLRGLTRAQARALITRLQEDDPHPLPPDRVERLIQRTGASPMLLRLTVGAGLLDGFPADDALELPRPPGATTYLLTTTLDKLSPTAWRLLDLLSVARRPINLRDPLLAELYGDARTDLDLVGAIEELQRHQVLDDPRSGEVHPLLREAVAERLAGDPARHAMVHRLAAAWFEQGCGDALEAGWHLGQAGDFADAADILTEHVRELLRRGQGAGAATLVGELATRAARRRVGPRTLRQLHLLRGDLLVHTDGSAEAEAAYRSALAHSGTPVLRADVAWRLAENMLQRGDAQGALDLTREARAEVDDQGLLAARLAAAEARADLVLSRYEEALDCAERALAAATRLDLVVPVGAAEVRARAGLVLGVVHRLHRRSDPALRHLRRAASAARVAGLDDLAARCDFNGGAVLLESGRRDAAVTAWEQALQTLRSLGDSYGAARVLHALAEARRQTGRLEEALALVTEAVALKARVGDRHGLANSEHLRATVLVGMGRVDQARTTAQDALVELEALGDRWPTAHCLDNLVIVELVAGRLDVARAHVARGLEVLGTVDPHLRALLRIRGAWVGLLAGRSGEAERLLQDGDPASDLAEVALERLALSVALAVARSRPDEARAFAGALAELVASTGWAVYAGAAQRLSRAPAPALERIPAVLWAGSTD